MANFSSSLVFSGLGTLSVVVPDAGIYTVTGKSSIPTLSTGGGISSLVITINNAGSPVYTGSAGLEGFVPLKVTCTAGATLTFVYSSSAAVDAVLNAVKSTVEVAQGF